MNFILLFLLSGIAFGIGCDPRPSGNCSQVDGIDTCKVNQSSYCFVSRGTSCSRVNNNSGAAIFIGGKDETIDWDSFHEFVPRGVSVTSCGCSGGFQTWEVAGARCEGILPPLAHAQTFVLTDSTGAETGSATFSCSGATVTGPTGSSCNSLPTPQCPATLLSWSEGGNTCEANASLSDDGTIFSATDSSGTTGTATFTCVGNAWSPPSSPDCNPIPTPKCPATLLTWSEDGNTCEANASESDDGTVFAATDSIGTTGSASFTCSGTTWSPPASPVCNPSPTPQCPATLLTWSEDGNNCEANVSASDDGTIFSATDSTGTTGTASFTCEETTWSAPASANCEAPVSGCSLALPHSWTVNNGNGDRTCTLAGTGSEAFTDGQERTFTGAKAFVWDPYSMPNRGSITYRCSGTGLTVVSQTCVADCTIRCEGPLGRHSWYQSSPSIRCYCNGGQFETITHGGTRTFFGEGFGSPAWGSLKVSCNDGTPNYFDKVCNGGAPP